MPDFPVQIPVQIWDTILAFLARSIDYPSLLRVAETSKTLRERVITFWNGSLSVTREIEAIVSEPRRDTRSSSSSVPSVGILRPRRVSELALSSLASLGQQHGWSILQRANSACIRTSDAGSDIALLMDLAPGITALTVILTAPIVPLQIAVDARVRCMIIVLTDPPDEHHSRPGPGPGPGPEFIRCPGVTHLVVAGRHSFRLIDTPNATHMLIGSAQGSLDGLERLTSLVSLAIKDTGTDQGVLRTIGRCIGALVHLRTLHIGFSSHDALSEFTLVALPSLTNLAALTVCTPAAGAATDWFLRHARAHLTGLESLGLTGLTGLTGLMQPWSFSPPVSLSVRASLPDAAGLRKLDIHDAWYSSWLSWPGLSAITELSLVSIGMVWDLQPTITHQTPTSLRPLRLASMRSLTALKISGMRRLHTLSGISPLSLTSLAITKCAALTPTGCTLLGSMLSLVELSVTNCAPAIVPSLIGLTRLVALHIDLHDNEDYASYTDDPIDEDDSSCYTEIPETPPSLRRLRLHSENSSAALGRPQLGYMARLAEENPHLTELSISYWDGAWVSGTGLVPKFYAHD